MAVQEKAPTLAYAVRGKVVLKYLGQLLLLLAMLDLAPAAVALGYDDGALALRFAGVALVMVLVALPWVRLAVPAALQTNEALVVTALVFLIGALSMIFPFMDAGISFSDALFEAVSGITTTGLSCLGSVEHMPKAFLFARAWMQWYGGLGIVVLSLALLMGNERVARRLLGRPAEGEGMAVGIRRYSRQVVGVYLALTLLVVLALWATGLDGLSAVAQALSAVSTGGFSTHDDSLAGLGSEPAVWIVTVASLSGALALAVYYRIWEQGWRALPGDTESRTLLGAAALSCGLLTLSLHWADALPWSASLREATLQGISAQTTTGFSSLDVGGLQPLSRVIMMLAMFVGGDIGSTAGGVKILRLLVLLRLLQFIVRTTGSPSHAVNEPRLGGRRVSEPEFVAALSLLAMFALVILLSWVPFLALGYDPLNSLFEVVSATATTGLSAGISGPGLEPALKGVLCFDMLAGRLEIVALLVLFYPRTWIGKRINDL
jgi:trk system potassium uptake protein TrkH